MKLKRLGGSLALPIVAAMFAVTSAAAEEVTVDAESVVRYVESCRKPNGAYGPADQEYTDSAWTGPAVGILQLMQVELTRTDDIVAHGLGVPRGHAGWSHRNFAHHHQLRGLLRQPITPFHDYVEIAHDGFKVEYYASPLGNAADVLFKSGGDGFPAELDANADTFHYYNLASLNHLLIGLRASGREPADPQPLVDYVLRRQAPNGGFADERTGHGAASDFDASLLGTGRAAIILQACGASLPNPDMVAAFIRACRNRDGSYRWNPRASLPGNVGDVLPTMIALHTLKRLGEEPDELDATRAWLNSLQNADGGFGDRPGWRSRLESTYYAAFAFASMPGEIRDQITTKTVTRPVVEPIPDGEFQIYQAQFKMPVVQPGDLAGLNKRGFNLLALKSEKFTDAEPLLAAIREQKLPMDVVLCPEMYPHRLTQIGGPVLNHVGNFTLDPRWTAEQKEIWKQADAAGREYLPWTGYRDRVIKPVAELGSFAYPEQDFELDYAMIAYGDDRSGTRGYNAVLCGFNWPPRDFVRVFPWRERYVDRLVPIADVDAHGDLAKWSDQLDACRTMFIAKGPTYADFQAAAAAGRVVTVIAKPEGVPSGATYYGPPAAVAYVKQRRAEWQWWE